MVFELLDLLLELRDLCVWFPDAFQVDLDRGLGALDLLRLSRLQRRLRTRLRVKTCQLVLLRQLLRRLNLVILVHNGELCRLLLLLELVDPLLRSGLLVEVLVDLLLESLEKRILLRHFGWAILLECRHSIV